MLIYLNVFICTVLLTYLIRRYSYHKDLLDHPNDRSSHSVATPKGGGLAIILVFYTVLTYLFMKNQLDTKLFFALFSAVPIAIVSLLDDIYTLPVKTRLLIQLVSAIFALYFLGGVNTFEFISFSLSNIFLNLISLLAILWMTNLYNFLDGIDGYAGGEAVFVGLSAFVLFDNEVSLLLAVSCAGFLVFNWHRASIFMGDVGSAPLGFIFAVLMLNDASTANFIDWLILLSIFWFDATLTLFRRLRNKEQLSKAHKKHAYQRLHQAGFSHSTVVLLAMCLNLCMFFALYYVDQNYHLYLLLPLIVVLFFITKWIDSKKAFN